MSIFQGVFQRQWVGSLVQGGTGTLVNFFIGNIGRQLFFFPAFVFFVAQFTSNRGKTRTHDRSMTATIERDQMSTTAGKTNRQPLPHPIKINKPRSFV